MTITAVILAMVAPQTSSCSVGANWSDGRPPGEFPYFIVRKARSLTWNDEIADEAKILQYVSEVEKKWPREAIIIDTTNMKCPEVRRIAHIVETHSTCTPDLCAAYAVASGQGYQGPVRPPIIYRQRQLNR